MMNKLISYFGTFTPGADGAVGAFQFEYLTSLGFAALVIFAGRAIVRRSHVLRKFAIPAPVISGLLFSVLIAIFKGTGILAISFDTNVSQRSATVSANSGGIAVSGTCSLYGMWEDRGIAVWIEQRLCADGKVLCYRTIRSSRDFKGGYNHFLTSSDLKTWSYPQLLETLSALRKDGCRYERAA